MNTWPNGQEKIDALKAAALLVVFIVLVVITCSL